MIIVFSSVRSEMNGVSNFCMIYYSQSYKALYLLVSSTGWVAVISAPVSEECPFWGSPLGTCLPDL